MSVRMTMTQKSGGYYPFDQQLGVKVGISKGVRRIVVKLIRLRAMYTRK